MNLKRHIKEAAKRIISASKIQCIEEQNSAVIDPVLIVKSIFEVAAGAGTSSGFSIVAWNAARASVVVGAGVGAATCAGVCLTAAWVDYLRAQPQERRMKIQNRNQILLSEISELRARLLGKIDEYRAIIERSKSELLRESNSERRKSQRNMIVEYRQKLSQANEEVARLSEANGLLNAHLLRAGVDHITMQRDLMSTSKDLVIAKRNISVLTAKSTDLRRAHKLATKKVVVLGKGLHRANARIDLLVTDLRNAKEKNNAAAKKSEAAAMQAQREITNVHDKLNAFIAALQNNNAERPAGQVMQVERFQRQRSTEQADGSSNERYLDELAEAGLIPEQGFEQIERPDWELESSSRASTQTPFQPDSQHLAADFHMEFIEKQGAKVFQTASESAV